MTIATENVTTVVTGSNDLVIETTQALVDVAFIAPRQAMEINQAIVRSLDAQRQANREVAERLVRQTMEARGLWWQLIQTSVQLGIETFTGVAQTGSDASRAQQRITTSESTGTDKKVGTARP